MDFFLTFSKSLLWLREKHRLHWHVLQGCNLLQVCAVFKSRELLFILAISILFDKSNGFWHKKQTSEVSFNSALKHSLCQQIHQNKQKLKLVLFGCVFVLGLHAWSHLSVSSTDCYCGVKSLALARCVSVSTGAAGVVRVVSQTGALNAN